MSKLLHNQAGQTLVETMVAIFIMVMGVTTALGLAIYSLNASTNISKQIVAVGLAREGIEVIKNMRDTNWLRDSLASDCYDYPKGNQTQYCYKDWLNSSGGTNFNFDSPSDEQDYTISYDSSNELMWTLSNPISDKKVSNFTLFFDSSTSSNLFFPDTSGDSDYYRKITISKDSSLFPYDVNSSGTNEYPLLKVTSRVWWKGKGCPVRALDDDAPDDSTTDERCMIVLRTYLTNWKNYE